MRHALFRHASTYGIAGVKLMRLAETKFRVPGIRPMATTISWQPQTVTRDHDVVTNGLPHIAHCNWTKYGRNKVAMVGRKCEKRDQRSQLLLPADRG